MNSSRGRRYWTVALAATMALTAALRLPGLGNTVLSNDEAYAWRVTQYSLTDWLERTRYDANPPFYYLVIQGWQQLSGSSPWALRGLSVLLAVLTVPLTYGACLEALKRGARSEGRGARADDGNAGAPTGSWRAGALLSAFLVAVHASQVVQGRNARMYALGIFLTALSTWLLLKGLGDARQRWWIGYGMSAAALALTHYYGLFTLAAQGLFAGGFLLVRLWRQGWAETKERVGGLVYAAVLGGILFAPWLSAFRGQVEDVREGFWIPDVNIDHVKQVFWPWCTGLPYLDRWETLAWLSVLGVCPGWTILSREPGGWLFLLMSAFPWGCAIALSVTWQRSIFYDRYLSFAQWALLCYWGVTCARLGGWQRNTSGLACGGSGMDGTSTSEAACGTGVRLVLGTFIAASAVAGIDWRVPTGPPALAQAGEFLKQHARPGDQVWVNGAAEVNRVRYYADQAGLPDLWVRCQVSLGQKGHIVHLSSLSGEDILESDAMQNPPARFWQASEAGSYPPAGTRQVLEASFKDERSSYTVALYERVNEAKRSGAER